MTELAGQAGAGGAVIMPGEAGNEATDGSDARGGRILLIDDNEPSRYALRRQLERDGFELLEAADGESGLALAEQSPDLVILDVNLPDISGLDVCRRLRASPATRRLPILQLSATAVDPEAQVVGLESGADVYLVEPVDRTVLVATIRSLLRTARAERAAWQRGREWQTTFDAIASPVCLLDPAGTVIRANLAFARLVGKPPQGCVGDAFEEAVDPNGAAPALHLCEEVRRTGLGASGQGRIGGRWHQLNLDPILDVAGELAGMAATLTDIDDRRRVEVDLATALATQQSLYESAQQARRLLEAVVEQLPVALVVADAESGRLILRNGQVDRIWHIGPDAAPLGAARLDDLGLVGRHSDGRPYAAEDWPLARSIAGGAVVTGEEIEVERADGSTAVISISSGPVRGPDGAIVAGVATFADVTARRESELLRDTFIGVLSHELRTPITTIYAGATLLARPEPALDAATRQEVVTDVADEAERLLHLVENLLVFARIERGVSGPDREPVLVQHVLRRVVADEQRRWPAVRFRLQLAPAMPAVASDEGQLELALRNLLSNAGKYGDGEQGVDVVAEQDGQEVVVRVLDRGPGIPPGEEANLFRVFYRARQTAGVAPGAGLGLFIVRSLVEQMDGRVWAANRLDGGAEFGLALPAFEE